jgi:hypothetical protein
MLLAVAWRHADCMLPRMPMIDYALSIGPNCRAKYHLRRRYARDAVNGVFDWQGTPASSCIAYLEADFIGVFEREDLEIRAGSLRKQAFRHLAFS